ncbi:putative calcium-dependent phosphate transporter [Hamiltosporidium magnivora]|uniref:Putative calcium-dependent phosphate transporter n=1 Tax=Hamiltosporidium magnivora TaxID=148818 RepID=A0A4Q9LPF4_9MICR|nr:putative calcium-dependent phosphate transporter [Hamiltosporidium magnivora]
MEEKDLDIIAQKPKLSSSDSAIKVNLITQIAISVGCLVFFVIVRPKMKWLFTPNTRNKPKHPGYGYDGYFSWVLPILTVDDVKLLSVIGLDCFMMLQSLKMLYRIFLVLIFFTVPTLCFVYWHGNNQEENLNQLFLKLSITNFKKKDIRIWLPVIAVHLTSLVIFYLVYIYYKKFVPLRQAYIRNPATMTSIPTLKRISFDLSSVTDAIEYVNMPARTLLFTRLPSFIEDDDDLAQFVTALGVGEIEDCILVRNTKNLNKYCQAKEVYIREIEREIDYSFRNINDWSADHVEKCEKNISGFDKKNVILTAEHNFSDQVFEDEEKTEIVKKYFAGFKSFKRKHKKNEIALDLNLSKLQKTYQKINDEKIALHDVKKPEDKDVIELMGKKEALFPREDYTRNVSFFSFSHFIHINKHYKYFTLELPVFTKTGFVTFKSKKAANIIAQSLIGSKVFSCTATPAPAPKDIIWAHINMGEVEAYFKNIIGTLVFIILIFAFYTLVFILTGFLHLNKLEQKFPNIKIITKFKTVKESFDGIVTPLIYNALLCLAPIFLTALSYSEGVHCYSLLQYKMMDRYGLFLLFNGFLALMFTSTFFTMFKDLYTGEKQFGEVIEDIGKSLIDSAVFFSNTIIQRALMGNVMFLLKPLNIFIQYFVDHFGDEKTRREKIESRYPVSLDFGFIYPTVLLCFPMTLSYSVISPLILFIGAFYYITTYLVFKNECLYAVGNNFEAGGIHWDLVCKYVIYSLIIFQSCSAAQIFVLGSKLGAFSIIPMIIITVYFKKGIETMFTKSCNYYPLNVQEEQYIDEFSAKVLQERTLLLEDWDETADDIDIDSVGLDSLGFCDVEEQGKKFPYRDPSLFSSFSRLFLPHNFIKTMCFIEKYDKNNIFKMRDETEESKGFFGWILSWFK